MKKFFVFFLFFYSSLGFSQSFEELELLFSERHPEFAGDHLIGHTLSCSEFGFYSFFDDYGWFCHAIGWQKIIINSIDVAGEQYPYYYWHKVEYQGLLSDSVKCPLSQDSLTSFYDFLYKFSLPSLNSFLSFYKPLNGSPFDAFPVFIDSVGGGCCHTICVADVLAYGGNPYTDDTCNPIPKAGSSVTYKLLVCFTTLPQLSSSETTAKTKNKLKAEANSKLGSIANSSATNSNLLGKILDAIKNIKIPTDSSSPPDVPPPEPSSEPLLDLNGKTNLAVSPFMQGVSSCPASKSLTVFNHDFSISYQPICDLAVRVKPLVIASARVTAAWIILGAL